MRFRIPLLLLSTIVLGGVLFFGGAHITLAAPDCGNGKFAPEGWQCPSQPYSPNGPQYLRSATGSNSNGDAYWGPCYLQSASNCINGWTPYYCNVDVNGIVSGWTVPGHVCIGVSAYETVSGTPTGGTPTSTPGGTPGGTGGDTAGGTGGTAPPPEKKCTKIPGARELCEALTAISGWFTDIGIGTFWYFMSLFARMFFWSAQLLLWIATSLLDFAIYMLVINMGVFVNNTGATGIREAWTILRDLANVMIIGGFVAVGISTILQVQQYNANKFLSRLIIAALLVNFSYFIAGAIIDSSNYIATEIYKSNIMQKACNGHTINLPANLRYRSGNQNDTNPGVRIFSDDYLCSWSEHLTASIGLGSWVNIEKLAGKENGLSPWNSQQFSANINKKLAVIGYMGGFFMVVTGFVFFSAAILLIGRFVVLILLLVTSPIGIAGANIPYIDKYASRWWDALMGQAFFAPIYFLLVAISLVIIKDLMNLIGNPQTDGTSFAVLASGSYQDAMNVIPLMLTFFVAMAFMYASLQIAKQMSESGKEFFGQIYGALDKKLGGIYGNLYQVTARRALALPSQAYDQTLGRLSKVPVIGGVFAGAGLMLRPDKTAKPFGATKTADEIVKESQEYSASIPRLKDQLRALKNMPDALKRGIMGTDEDALLEKDWDELTPDERRRLKKYVRSHYTDDQLKKMTPEELEKLMPYLSSAQAKLVLDNGGLSPSEREMLVNARFKPLDKAANAAQNSRELAQKARDAGDEEGAKKHDADAERYEAEMLEVMQDMDETDHKLYLNEREERKEDSRYMALLDRKTFDAVTSDRTIFTAEQQETAKTKRGEGITNILTNGTDKEIKGMLKRMSDDEIKDTKPELLTQKVINQMSLSQLRLRYHEGTDAGRQQINIVLEQNARDNKADRESGDKNREKGANRPTIADVQYVRPNYSGRASADSQPIVVEPNQGVIGAARPPAPEPPPSPKPGNTNPPLI